MVPSLQTPLQSLSSMGEFAKCNVEILVNFSGQKGIPQYSAELGAEQQEIGLGEVCGHLLRVFYFIFRVLFNCHTIFMVNED